MGLAVCILESIQKVPSPFCHKNGRSSQWSIYRQTHWEWSSLFSGFGFRVQGWSGALGDPQFERLKSVLMAVINACVRGGVLSTIGAVVEVGAAIHRKEQRREGREALEGHLAGLAVWRQDQFWRAFLNHCVNKASYK